MPEPADGPSAPPRVWDTVHIDIQVTADAVLSPALAAALEQLRQVVAAEGAEDAVQGYQHTTVGAAEVAGFFPRVGTPLRYNVQYRHGAPQLPGAPGRRPAGPAAGQA